MRLVVRLLALAVGCLLALTLLEIALRVLDPLRTGETLDRETFLEDVLVRHPNGDITMTPSGDDPSDWAELFGQSIRIRENGFRDDPLEVPKPEGRYRILVIGDSVAFGWGVAEESAFPQVLERELNAANWPDAATEVEVFCASAPGWGLPHYLQFAQREAQRLQPDAVVVTLIDNDLTDILEANGVIPPASGAGRPPVASLVRDLFVTRAVHRLWVTVTDVDENPGFGALIEQSDAEDFLVAAGLEATQTDTSVDMVLDALTGIRELCRPARFAIADTLGTVDGKRVIRLVEGLSSRGIDHIECYLDVKEHELSPVDRHPDDGGHQILADKIGAWIRSR